MTRPRFLAIGHVARDEFPDGAHRLGGTAVYAAATAARLGVPTALLTRVGPGEKDDLERACGDLGIELHALPSRVTTTFSFRWDEDGHRVLRLRARAKGISLADVPAQLHSAGSLVFGSIARELSRDLLAGEAAQVSVLVAQGLLRAWDADGTIRPSPWADAKATMARLTAVVLSEDDVDRDDREVREWSHSGPVVLTLAERGCRLYEGGEVTHELPAYPPARVVDTTGAGDTFAAGLAVALGEGSDLAAAARFANAVASFGLEGEGISALATREEVERRARG